MTRNYNMGMSFGGTAIPDPSTWDCSINDLDTSAERDGTGLLHRARVGEKINYSFTWNALTWAEMAAILNAVRGESFYATCPSPYAAGGTRSGTYYVGERKSEMLYYWVDKTEVARYNLSFNIIEF